MQDGLVLAVFALVYLGMLLGRLPGLALDRTGVCLLGAIALVATGRVSLAEAWSAIDVPTIALLFGLMLVSAQLRLGGFYTRVAQALGGARLSPPGLLALWIAVAALLSALLANDVVCLAATPVLVEACARRRLDPVPFLVALACGSNVGSAATLIGNPQNMLIGEALGLSFAGYLALALPPVVLSLAATWTILALATRGRWERETSLPAFEPVPWDAWASAKAGLVLAGIVALFLAGVWPRELVALGGAGVLLLSRRTASPRALALVDWPLLLLFVGLFVVNHALAATGRTAEALAALDAQGLSLAAPGRLFVASAALSNLVSNVPATMLLLPAAAASPARDALGATLALSSTLAGNLLLVGSIANLIVAEQARRVGVALSWRRHAALGIPVTLATLALAAAWLALRAW